MGNQKLVHQLSKDIKKANKERQNLEACLNKVETLKHRNAIFKEVIDDRKAYITKDYLSKNENIVENLVKKFYKLFQKTLKTEFDVVAQNNPDMGGAFDILKRSCEELKKIDKRNNSVIVKKEEVTYEIYKMIKEIFTDNIKLRKKINGYLEAFLKQTENKIEEYLESSNFN